MEPNLDQTFMTPAASKNKVYFMWDFIGRTLGNLYEVLSNLQFANPNQREKWDDVHSRSALAAQLILDTMPGMLNTMTEKTYPGQAGQHPEFGEGIMESARKLTQ